MDDQICNEVEIGSVHESDEYQEQIDVKIKYHNLFQGCQIHNPLFRAKIELSILSKLQSQQKYVGTQESERYYQALEKLKIEQYTKPYVYANFESIKEVKIQSDIIEEFKQLSYVNCIALVYSTTSNKTQYIGNFLLILNYNPQQNIEEQANNHQVLEICKELKLKTLVGIMMKNELNSEMKKSCLKLMQQERKIDLIVGTFVGKKEHYYCTQKQGKQFQLSEVQEQEVLIRIGIVTKSYDLNIQQ